MESERIGWVDNLRGIGIFLVVLGHLSLPEIEMKIIYSFHMPLFFFISGFLFKMNRFEDKKIGIKKRFSSLIIPYLVFWIISFIFGIAVDFVSGKTLPGFIETLSELFFLNGSVGWNSPLWFLIVLFFIDVIFLFLKSEKQIVMVSLTGLIVGFLLSKINSPLPLGINSIAIGLFFYGLGYVFRKYSLIEKLCKSTFLFTTSTISFLMINLTCALLNRRISLYENVVGNYVYFILGAISGIVFVVMIVSRKRPVKILEFYGRNTLLILCTHYFFHYGYRIINSTFFNGMLLSEDPIYIVLPIVVITFLLYIPIINLSNKYAPFLTKPALIRNIEFKKSVKVS